MTEEERNGSLVAGIVSLFILLALLWMLGGVATGHGIVSTKSGCQAHLDEDPTWFAADWYGFGIGFCMGVM